MVMLCFNLDKVTTNNEIKADLYFTQFFYFLSMKTLYCKGYVKSRYPVYISDKAQLDDLVPLLPEVKQYFIIIDEEILKLFPDIVSIFGDKQKHVFTVKATENHKTLDELERLFDGIFALKPNRDDVVVAIGGGLITNIGGMAASLIMRGIRFYYVPTTLTGQIDASIGSKLAVNYKGAKNWIGTMNDPEFCYMNPMFLDTLTERDFNSQAIEGVKLALATDSKLFHDTMAHIHEIRSNRKRLADFITQMIEAKAEVVEKDLIEENYGMCMLYGHTVGHAIEMLDHEHINHGEGVGIGMAVAARISQALGIAAPGLVATHEGILTELNLPNRIPKHIRPNVIIEKLAHNKKNYQGEIRFVLLKDVGRMHETNGNFFTTVPEEIIKKAIEESY